EWLDDSNERSVGNDGDALRERVGAAGHDNAFGRDLIDVSHFRRGTGNQHLIGEDGRIAGGGGRRRLHDEKGADRDGALAQLFDAEMHLRRIDRNDFDVGRNIDRLRPRSRTLTVSGTGVVITSSRGTPISDNGAANARSETLSRLGADTMNQTTNARNNDSNLSARLETHGFIESLRSDSAVRG